MSGFCKCTSTLNRISSGPNIDRRQDMSKAARLGLGAGRSVSVVRGSEARVYPRTPGGGAAAAGQPAIKTK